MKYFNQAYPLKVINYHINGRNMVKLTEVQSKNEYATSNHIFHIHSNLLIVLLGLYEHCKNFYYDF